MIDTDMLPWFPSLENRANIVLIMRPIIQHAYGKTICLQRLFLNYLMALIDLCLTLNMK